MRTLLAAALAAGLALSAASADAKEWSKVRIGVEGAYPPFSQMAPDGSLSGFDIDIAWALCDAMDVECELVPQDWDGMIPALLARKYDAILASMSITEERKKRVDFTEKYYQTPATFVGRVDAGIEISPAGLAGKRVGVQRATTHDSYLSDNFGDDVEIVRYGTQDEVYLDLTAGRVDLILGDSMAIAQGFLETEAGAGYERIGPPLTDVRWFGEGAGIAIRKQDTDLRDKFNAAIDQIRADGTYDAIQAKYFTFDIYGS